MEIYTASVSLQQRRQRGHRPTITSCPANINWGGQFSVTSGRGNIGSALLMRPGSSTHAFDMDQRQVGLTFTAASGTLTVTGPPNAKIAPPGYYMLFLINSQGVPSVAKFLLLNGSTGNPAPTVSGIAPTSGTTGGGTPVTITGTGFLAGATVTIGGTAATGVTVVSSTSITATTPAHAAGAVSVVVKNTDSQTRNTDQRLHLYESGADGERDLADVRDDGGRDAGDDHGHGLPGGRDGDDRGNGGDGSNGSEQHVDHGDDTGARGGRGECGGEKYGCPDGTLTNGYTYTNPAPTVSGISPASGTTAGGTPVTITGTGFLAGATVTIGGTAATGVTVASSTSITATTPAHAAGAVNVVVTNTDSQSGTLDQRLHLH